MPASHRLVIRHHDPGRQRRLRWGLVLGWLGSLLLVSLAVSWFGRVAGVSSTRDTRQLASLRTEHELARRQIAALERSEQVARAALAELQGTLRERDEELEGLRADLAFYSRLVGGSRREGLAIHGLSLKPVRDTGAWNFTATLTQNFRRGRDVKGQLSLGVEGVAEGRLVTLDWAALEQAAGTPALEYSFRYFQRVSGTIMLPPGFAPNRVIVRAEGEGERVEQEFAWSDVVGSEEDGNVSR